MIKKDIAYNFMGRRNNKDSEKTSKTSSLGEKKTKTEELISKINRNTSRDKNQESSIENVRKTGDGFLLDVITEEGDVIKDLFLPYDKIYSRRSEVAQERIADIQDRQRKIMTFVIIYPAAIVSLMIIIHGFMQILPILQNLIQR